MANGKGAMFLESTYITIACAISYSLITDIYDTPLQNIALGLFTTWALTYGIIATRKLRTTKEAIEQLEAQVKSHGSRNDMKIADLGRKIQENHGVMMELRTRLILVQQSINKNNALQTPGSWQGPA